MWCLWTEYRFVCPNQNESDIHVFLFPVFVTLVKPVTLYRPFRSCSSSPISWHFWSFITSSFPSPYMLLWRCRSSWDPFSLAGIWTFIMRRVTRKLRSTPLISTRNLGRYETKAQEHNTFKGLLIFNTGASMIIKMCCHFSLRLITHKSHTFLFHRWSMCLQIRRAH